VALVADRHLVAGASDPIANCSYQLSQHVNTPRRDDTYSPGQRGQGDAAGVLAKLDATLSSLKPGGHGSKL
jgi:hypothetical protein